jgi:hypothetical protein
VTDCRWAFEKVDEKDGDDERQVLVVPSFFRACAFLSRLSVFNSQQPQLCLRVKDTSLIENAKGNYDLPGDHATHGFVSAGLRVKGRVLLTTQRE